jgi:hypothetical protein
VLCFGIRNLVSEPCEEEEGEEYDEVLICSRGMPSDLFAETANRKQTHTLHNL